jgi:Ammonium Transporter Family
MITHCVATIRKQEARRYFVKYLTGKMLGIGAVVAVVYGLVWYYANQLIAQIKGSATITAATLVAGLGLMYLVKLTRTLRVSPEIEVEGLDLHEHGAPAYHPEYAYMGYSPLPLGKGAGGAPVAVTAPVARSEPVEVAAGRLDEPEEPDERVIPEPVG